MPWQDVCYTLWDLFWSINRLSMPRFGKVTGVFLLLIRFLFVRIESAPLANIVGRFIR